MAGIDNLTPWLPGTSGNPAGKAPGTRNWSSIIQDLLNDPDLAESMLEKKPGWWDKLPNKNMHEAIGVAMGIKAMNGDVKAATWLRKTAYGDKIDITTDGVAIAPVQLYDMRAGVKLEYAPKKKSKKVVQRKKPVDKRGKSGDK